MPANENLPLRFCICSAELLHRHIAPYRKKLYQPALLPMPCPEFVAFYDGEKPEAEQRVPCCPGMRNAGSFWASPQAEKLPMRGATGKGLHTGRPARQAEPCGALH